MANRSFTQFQYSLHKMPVVLDCYFTIAAGDSAGYGQTGLIGPGVAQVFSHTSGTPAVYNGVTNNTAAGLFQVFLTDPYYNFYGAELIIESPQSGSSILVASAGVVSGTTYVITIVGTTTTAGWVSLGLPVGVTPAVGVAFVASATTTASGTGAVQVPHVNGSTVGNIEVIGNPKLTLAPYGAGAANPYIMFRTMGPTNSSTTTAIAKAPADGSIMFLRMYLSNSSVLVGGD